MYPCPSCGADLRFDIESQSLSCSYCGNKYEMNEYIKLCSARGEKNANANAVKKESNEVLNLKRYYCSQCGGEILCDNDTVATFCSYCGNTAMIEDKISIDRPEKIIPFKITKEKAFESYKKKLLSNPFLPSAFRKNITIEKVRGIYMPYDILKYEKHGIFHAYGARKSRDGDYICHTTYDIESNIDFTYEICGHDTSSKFDDVLSESIAPFNIEDAVDFDEKYLAGFYADAPDVKGGIYKDEYVSYLGDELGRKFAKNYNTYENLNCDLKRLGEDLLNDSNYVGGRTFFPVWFISCRHGKDKISYGVINGNTGESTAELPISFPKFIIGSILVSALVFVILTFVFNPVITHKMMLGICRVLSFISMLISTKIMGKVYMRENHFDDIGYLNLPEDKDVDVREEFLKKENKIGTSLFEGLFSVLTEVLFPFLFITFIVFPTFFLAIYLFATFINVENLNFVGFGFEILLVAIISGFIKNILKTFSDYKKSNKSFGFKHAKPFRVIVSSIWLQLIPFIASAIIIYLDLYYDDIFYLAAGISFAAIILSFYKCVINYNKLTCRKLPQFNKRGGDE